MTNCGRSVELWKRQEVVRERGIVGGVELWKGNCGKEKIVDKAEKNGRRNVK